MATTIAAAQPVTTLEQLAGCGTPCCALALLADADSFRSLGLDRPTALWQALRTPSETLPLFAIATASELAPEPEATLPSMALGAQVAADYNAMRLSLKAHPMRFVRAGLGDDVATCAATTAMVSGCRVRTAYIVLSGTPGNGNAIFVTPRTRPGNQRGHLGAPVRAEPPRRDGRAGDARRRRRPAQPRRRRPPDGQPHRRPQLRARAPVGHARGEARRNPPGSSISAPAIPRRTATRATPESLPKSRDFH